VASRGFLKEHAGRLDYLSRLVDPAIAAMWSLAMIYCCDFAESFDILRQLAMYGVVLIVFVFPSFGIYRSWRGVDLYKELQNITFAWITVTAFLNVILFLFSRGEDPYLTGPFSLFSQKAFLIWAMGVYITIALFRILLRFLLRWLRRRGYNKKWAVIVGAGTIGRRLSALLARNIGLGYKVVAFFDDDPEKKGQVIDGAPVLGSIQGMPAFLKENDVDCVFITLSFGHRNGLEKVFSYLNNFACEIKMIPDLFGYFLLNYSISQVGGLPAINVREGLSGADVVIKWVEDKVVALSLLIILAPLMSLIAFAIWIDSCGPIIFKQRRYGLNGREINVYKFRTMSVMENGRSVIQTRKDDPRVTRVGRILRKCSLDELPQLINVVQGRMSLVGPRPHAVAHNEQYRKLVRYYMLRHIFKPGITGWAQVNGLRGETESTGHMERRVKYDLDYINNWSLSFDIKILVLTLFKAFGGPNAY
jgi:putative colanic acid biosysnthesis UDP-glucose lipid carrier transferase